MRIYRCPPALAGLTILLLFATATGCSADAPGPVDNGAPTGESAAAEAPPAETAGTGAEQLDALRQAVRDRPDDLEARRRLGMALVASEAYEEALTHFRFNAEADPSARRLLDLGLASGSAGHYDDAEQAYDRLLTLEPGHAIALHNLGNIAVKRGQFERAIELYGKALASNPRYLLAQYHLGDALRQAERYQEAYRVYEKVLELEPTSPAELTAFDDALYQMASLDLQMGAYERAGALLNQLLQVNKTHPKAYYAMGQVLMHLDRPAEAQQAFEAHMRIQATLKPSGPMAHGE